MDTYYCVDMVVGMKAKRIFLFIGLKIAECSGLAGLGYWFWWVGYWAYKTTGQMNKPIWDCAGLGVTIHLFGLLVAFAIIIVGYYFWKLIIYNWNLTKRWIK